jgi:hypothetical protein
LWDGLQLWRSLNRPPYSTDLTVDICKAASSLTNPPTLRVPLEDRADPASVRY